MIVRRESTLIAFTLLYAMVWLYAMAWARGL